MGDGRVGRWRVYESSVLAATFGRRGHGIEPFQDKPLGAILTPMLHVLFSGNIEGFKYVILHQRGEPPNAVEKAEHVEPSSNAALIRERRSGFS